MSEITNLHSLNRTALLHLTSDTVPIVMCDVQKWALEVTTHTIVLISDLLCYIKLRALDAKEEEVFMWPKARVER